MSAEEPLGPSLEMAGQFARYGSLGYRLNLGPPVFCSEVNVRFCDSLPAWVAMLRELHDTSEIRFAGEIRRGYVGDLKVASFHAGLGLGYVASKCTAAIVNAHHGESTFGTPVAK